MIILLTDGENNGGLIDPNTAKEIAKSVGVRVYTIGVGTEGFAPVPVQTSNGVIMQREKINIDEKLLTQIANETGGKYYRAKDDSSLKNIYAEIDKLEKIKSRSHFLQKIQREVLSICIGCCNIITFRNDFEIYIVPKVPLIFCHRFHR